MRLRSGAKVAFGGLFGDMSDTVGPKVVEIMLSDPERAYTPYDFRIDVPVGIVEHNLEKMVEHGVLAKIVCRKGYYRNKPLYVVKPSKLTESMQMLSLAALDDRNGTNFLDAHIRRRERERVRTRTGFDPLV